MQQMIRSLLEVEFRVSPGIGRGDAIIPMLRKGLHDALVLDVSLPGCSGVQLLPALRAEWPNLGIVMLTTHENELCRRLALQRGADAFVGKHGASETLICAVRVAIARRRERARIFLQR